MVAVIRRLATLHPLWQAGKSSAPPDNGQTEKLYATV